MPALAPKAYYQAGAVEGPIEDPVYDDDVLDYEPMESEHTEEEALADAMAISEAEERTSGFSSRRPSSVCSRRPHRLLHC